MGIDYALKKQEVTLLAHSRYISLKVSRVPGYVLFALFGTQKINLLTNERANDFKKCYSFIF